METRDPDHPLVIFSPAGPTPRLEGFPLVTPAAQVLLLILGPSLFLFYLLQAISPTFMVVESQIGQPPWVTLDAVFEADPVYARGIGGIFGINHLPGSTMLIVAMQAMYVLAGSFLLSLWIRRERRWSGLHHLALAILLLGLAAFGSLLGFLVWEDRDPVVRVIDFFLPAVATPWMPLLVCGAAIVLAGLLDRWQRARALIGSNYRTE